MDVSGESLKLGGLVPIIVPENAWPYEDRNNKVQLHPELMKLTSSFEKSYLPEATKHRLWWTSKAGTVLLEVSFKGFKRQFLVSVDMANLLLYINKGSKKLQHFICEYGYSVDSVESFLQTLLSSKLVHSEQQGNDFSLAIS